MLYEYLTQGVKAGLLAGVVFGLLMAGVANPLVAHADALNHDGGGEHAGEVGGDHEHGHAAGGEGEAHNDAALPTAVNRGVSVLAGGLWAVLLGGVFFGVVYYFLEPAIPGTGASKSYVLGAAGFVTVSGAPWLALPPVSPGAQQSLAASTRLPLYAGMMIFGALTCLLAGYAYNRASESNGRATGVAVAMLPFGLLVIPALLAPTNAVTGGLSPALRNGLTGLFVFGQALLWLLLAVGHARFVDHASDASGMGVPSSSADGVTTAD